MCARRPALAMIGHSPIKGYCNGKRPLSFGARPWFDVLAATANTQLDFAWRARKCATVLALSGEEAQYARFTRAHNVPRGL